MRPFTLRSFHAADAASGRPADRPGAVHIKYAAPCEDPAPPLSWRLAAEWPGGRGIDRGTDAQIALFDDRVGVERLGSAVVNDLAPVEHVDLVGELQRQAEVLLDQENRQPGLLQLEELLAELLEESRC